jgi:hypothetical protein
MLMGIKFPARGVSTEAVGRVNAQALLVLSCISRLVLESRWDEFTFVVSILPERVLSRESRSVIYLTRLETRTKESNMYASHSVLNRLEGRNESKRYDPGHLLLTRGPGRSTDPPTSLFVDVAESERIRWYPKDGELCLGKTKPEETLVEVCSDSDVQIDRQTWV